MCTCAQVFTLESALGEEYSLEGVASVPGGGETLGRIVAALSFPRWSSFLQEPLCLAVNSMCVTERVRQ